MNAHDRRVTARYWPHSIDMDHDDDRYYEVVEWLNKNFGSCNFKKRRPPRWVWRPYYADIGNFSQMWVGTQFFFRKKEDYSWFLLKWDAPFNTEWNG